MNPVRHLGILQERAIGRLDRLHRLALNLPPFPTPDEKRTAAYVVIEIANLWSAVARSFYLSCVLRARRVSGMRVKLGVGGIQSIQDGIHFAVQTLKPRSVKANRIYHPLDEPTWHKRETLLDLANALTFSNTADIQLALNLSTNAFTDIVVFRNFFAHRSQDTARRAQLLAPRYGQSSTKPPADIMCGVGPGRSQNILADWSDDIRITIDYMCT
jgi:hypothetical protein